MKLAHLQLHDSMSNKFTLIANLKDGSIHYSLFTGWANYGTGCSLSNLQVGYKHQSELPLDNDRELSVEEWRGYVVDILNSDSVYEVVHIVPNRVKF